MPRIRPTALARFRLRNVGTLTAALGACVVLGAGAAGAAVEFRYERALDLTRHEDGRLLPVSVTCDVVSGGVVVTDAAHGILHVFNGAGIETFRTTGFAGLSQPDDGAIDHAGRLLGVTLADGTRYTLARLDVYGEPDGWTAAAPRDDWRPDHVLVARDGNYVTIDGTTGLLAKHDAATGDVMWAKVIAEPEADAGDLEMGLGRPVELADGSYAVPGSNLHRIVLVGEDGEVRTSFGRFGSSPGRMVAPVAVAEGPGGTLLVLDQMRHKILAFGADQEFISEFGSIGDAPGAFYHPVSIATDGSGHLFVAQGYRGRVQVFSVLAAGAVE
jgi:hypothetical protein